MCDVSTVDFDVKSRRAKKYSETELCFAKKKLTFSSYIPEEKRQCDEFFYLKFCDSFLPIYFIFWLDSFSVSASLKTMSVCITYMFVVQLNAGRSGVVVGLNWFVHSKKNVFSFRELLLYVFVALHLEKKNGASVGMVVKFVREDKKEQFLFHSTTKNVC